MSIALDQVTKRYQGVPVVNDVSLNVRQGEFLVLLGPSGSGKSTLLRAIAGLTEIDHGRVSLHGKDVTHLTARQRQVGFVFQHYALFRHMSIGDNIEFALRVRKVLAQPAQAIVFKLGTPEMKARADAIEAAFVKGLKKVSKAFGGGKPKSFLDRDQQRIVFWFEGAK